MPIQIVITGDNANQALSELNLLATAIGMCNQPSNIPAVTTVEPIVSFDNEKENVDNEDELKEDFLPEKLDRHQQDQVVDDIIASGDKDRRFSLLTKGRQKKINDHFEKLAKKEVEKDNNETLVKKVSTYDDARELMGDLSTDEDGNPIQKILVKISDLIKKYVPEGEKLKLSNVPKDDFQDFYDELEALKDE